MPLKMRLENWMCHERLELSFDSPVAVVVSRNMAGKSAIRDAVEFAIAGTGHLRGITTKKDLAAFSIREDQPECAVELIVGSLYVKRSMNRAGGQVVEISTGGTIMKPKKLGEAQAMIWEALQLNEGQLRAILAAEGLFVLSPNDRRNLVSSLLGNEGIDPEELIDQFTRRGISQADAQEFADLVRSVGWRKAEETAGSRRAEAKSGIKAFGDVSEPDPMFRPPWRKKEEPLDLRTFDVADVERRLNSLRETLADSEKQEARDLGALEGRLTALENEQGSLQIEIEKLCASPGPNIAACEEAVRVAQQDMDLESEAVSALMEEAAKLEPLALLPDGGNLVRPDPCPVIAGGPKCPMSKAKMDAHQKTLYDASAKAKQELEAINERLAQAREVAKAKEGQLVDARNALHRQTAVRDKLAGCNDRLSHVEGEIEQLSKQIADAPEPKPSGDGKFIRDRIEQGEKVMAARQQFERDRQAIADHGQQVTVLKRKQERYDRIAQSLKPDGIELVFSGRMASPLREALERFGKRFGGIRLDSEFNVELHWEERWRRWQQLSESGRLRIGYAVQFAFAKACGFPLLVLDQVDHLDQQGKWDLLETLVDIAPEFESVLALATLQQDKPTRPPFDDVSLHLLEGGGCWRVE